MTGEKLKIGISACLLGIKCRYDGGDKSCPLICELLKDRVQFVPACPEFDCGFGAPRPPMRLEASPHGARIRVIGSGEDKTAELTKWIQAEVKLMAKADIAGFIFKAKSPTCGLREVELFSPSGRLLGKRARGLFAAAMLRRFPGLTVADETGFPAAAEKLTRQSASWSFPAFRAVN